MDKAEEVNCRPSKEGWFVDLADGDEEILAGPYPTLAEAVDMVHKFGMKVRTILPHTLGMLEIGALFKYGDDWFYVNKPKCTSAEVKKINGDLQDLPMTTLVHRSVLSTT